MIGSSTWARHARVDDVSTTLGRARAAACQRARGLGLEKCDRVAILAHNAVEWMENYAATAGLMMEPINFRLGGAEARYLVEEAPRLSLRSTTSWAPWTPSAAIFR